MAGDPRRFAHYRVLRRADGSLWTLGSGAMGVTYKATDERLEVDVALKVIAEGESARPGTTARFLKEARAAARIRHPNVASVLYLHDTPGELFFAMEFIDGTSLAEWLPERAPLAVADAIDLGLQLTRGLGAIHAQGIVHRDLKPANIMAVRQVTDGAEGKNEWQFKIIDFGVARVPAAADVTATADGIFCGTAAYASPEQAEHGAVVDGRADLYALGCILWEALCGHPPFRAGNTRDLLTEHAVKSPPFEEIAHLPPSLAAVLMRLLAKDREERPATAAEVERALTRVGTRVEEGLERREPTGLTESFFRAAVARETTLPFHPTPARKPRRILPAIVGLGVLVAALLLGWFWWRGHPRLPSADPATRRIVAVLPFESPSASAEDTAFSDGMQEDVISNLSRLADLRVVSRTSVQPYRTGPRSGRQIAGDLGVGTIVEGSVRRLGERLRVRAQLVDSTNDAVLWAETFDRPWQNAFELQSEIAASIAEAVQGRLVPGQKPAAREQRPEVAGAYELYRRGIEAFRKVRAADNENAIVLFQKAIAQDPPYALAHAALGDAYVAKVDHFEAPIYWLDSAILAAEKAVTLDPRCAEGHAALGAAYASRGWFARARGSFQKAVELKPSFAEPTIRLANLFFLIGRWEDAWKLARRAAELEPHSPAPFFCLANLLFGVGSDDEGERWTRRGMARLDDAIRRQQMEIYIAHCRRDYPGVLRLVKEREAFHAQPVQHLFGEISGQPPPGYFEFMANWRLGDLAACRRNIDTGLAAADLDGFNYRQILASAVVLLRAEKNEAGLRASCQKLIELTDQNMHAGSDAPEPHINKAVAAWLLGERERAESEIAAAMRAEYFIGRGDQDDTNVDALADCAPFVDALAGMNARLTVLQKRLAELEKENPYRGP